MGTKIYSVEDNVAKVSIQSSSDFYTYPSGPKSGPTLRLVLTAILSVLSGGFHFGFQISVINPLAEILQDFLVGSMESRYSMNMNAPAMDIFWSTVAGCLFIGAAIGAYLMSLIIEKYGPRKGIVIASVVLLISVPLCGFSQYLHSFELFVTGRLLTGLGIGMGTTAHGVFLAEISPVVYRGLICSFGGFSTNIGFILAGALGLPIVIGTNKMWPYIYYVEAVVATISLLSALVWFHDSPIFLLKNNRLNEAEKAFNAYCGSLANEELARCRMEMKNEVSTNGLREILRKKSTRKALLLAVTLNVVVSFRLFLLGPEPINLRAQSNSNLSFIVRSFSSFEKVLRTCIWRRNMLKIALSITVVSQVLPEMVFLHSGILAVSFFGTFLLRSIGFDDVTAPIANCLSALSGTVGAVVGTFTVERIGRRILVLGSLLLLSAVNTSMMVLVYVYNSSKEIWLGWAFLGLFIAFLFLFSAGIGPTAWFLGAELAPSSARAKIQSISVAAQYVSCFISPIIYYPLNGLIGPLSFLVFIFPLTLSAFYFQSCLPETKGRSSDEITAMLE